eukprot:352775-Chlamydomonas_euryale.AAC.2
MHAAAPLPAAPTTRTHTPLPLPPSPPCPTTIDSCPAREHAHSYPPPRRTHAQFDISLQFGSSRLLPWTLAP